MPMSDSEILREIARIQRIIEQAQEERRQRELCHTRPRCDGKEQPYTEDRDRLREVSR